jgi:Tol biopolymer transport system component
MNYQYVYWSADGKGLFVTHGVKGGSELVHMDLQGNMKALWKNNGGYYPWGLQSPDGRHLAIQGSVFSSNMWIMENF